MIDQTNIKQYLLDHSVEQDGPLDTPCLVWTRARSSGGRYGRVRYNGWNQNVHRVSYKVFVGPIPKDRFICHRCDNPACIRPEHLYCGTAATNNQDTLDRDRRPKRHRSRLRRLAHLDIDELLNEIIEAEAI
jgi:hypothetical protein